MNVFINSLFSSHTSLVTAILKMHADGIKNITVVGCGSTEYEKYLKTLKKVFKKVGIEFDIVYIKTKEAGKSALVYYGYVYDEVCNIVKERGIDKEVNILVDTQVSKYDRDVTMLLENAAYMTGAHTVKPILVFNEGESTNVNRWKSDSLAKLEWDDKKTAIFEELIWNMLKE